MNSQSTTIREAVWSEKQKLFAAEKAARAQAERIADISAHFHFSKNDSLTFLTADGSPVQLAMDMTEKVSGRVRTVICKVQDGEWFWLVENMAKCPVEASDLIACVKQRIGARLACQLNGKVMVQ